MSVCNKVSLKLPTSPRFPDESVIASQRLVNRNQNCQFSIIYII